MRTFIWVCIGIIVSCILFTSILSLVGGMLGWVLAISLPFGVGWLVGLCTSAPWHKKV